MRWLPRGAAIVTVPDAPRPWKHSRRRHKTCRWCGSPFWPKGAQQWCRPACRYQDDDALYPRTYDPDNYLKVRDSVRRGLGAAYGRTGRLKADWQAELERADGIARERAAQPPPPPPPPVICAVCRLPCDTCGVADGHTPADHVEPPEE